MVIGSIFAIERLQGRPEEILSSRDDTLAGKDADPSGQRAVSVSRDDGRLRSKEVFASRIA